MPLTIGITDCKEWANYERWIKDIPDPQMGDYGGIGVVMLKAGDGESSFVSHCDGVILTGGEDVDPSNYGKPEYIERYKLTDCNPERDKFEFGVLEQAEEFKVPLLGICRGLQLANVYFKGTLIPDLPSIGKTIHSRGASQPPLGGAGGDTVHDVTLKMNSRLRKIIGTEKGQINSHHHQAASNDGVGKGLMITAISDDGVVEGMEKNKRHDKDFVLLVQWHPERMDVTNPFSGRLRDAFLNACREYNEFTSLNQSISTAP